MANMPGAGSINGNSKPLAPMNHPPKTRPQNKPAWVG